MTNVDVKQQITDSTQLREVYRDPAQGAIDKVIDHVDELAADFIAKTPFVVIASASHDRADASPRGGPPGFIRVLDRHRVAWGDLTGNNRLDSFGNLLERSNIGMLFIVPGVVETLRISGTAELRRDADILEACAIDDRLPKVAVVVQVRHCYIQCGAALRRSEMWDPTTWPAAEDRPNGAAILKKHIGAQESAEEIEAGLTHYYDNFIWLAGGKQG